MNTTLAMSIPTDTYLKIEKFREEIIFQQKPKLLDIF